MAPDQNSAAAVVQRQRNEPLLLSVHKFEYRIATTLSVGEVCSCKRSNILTSLLQVLHELCTAFEQLVGDMLLSLYRYDPDALTDHNRYVLVGKDSLLEENSNVNKFVLLAQDYHLWRAFRCVL